MNSRNSKCAIIDVFQLITPLRIDNKQHDIFIERYLKDIFREISLTNVNDPTETQYITEYILGKYLNFPLILTQKLYTNFKNKDGTMSFLRFVEIFNIFHTGCYETLTKVIFDIYDFNNDGLIYINDCRLILIHLALSNENKLSLEKIISKTDELLKLVFYKTHMTLKDFRFCLEKKSSDLFLILLIYILFKTPFNDEILSYYKNDKRIKNVKKRVKWIEKINVIRYSEVIKIYIGIDNYNKLSNNEYNNNYFNDEDLDADELEINALSEDVAISEIYDLKKFDSFVNPLIYSMRKSNAKLIHLTTKSYCQSTDALSLIIEKKNSIKLDYDLSLKDISVKSYSPMKDMIDVKNFSNTFSKVDASKIINQNNKPFFENVLHKYNRKKKSVNCYYIVLHNNGDMFYFRDRMKNSFIGMHNLVLSFLINDQPVLKNINDSNYYSIQITICEKVKEFLCKNEEECKLWIFNLKKILKYQSFKDHYVLEELISQGKIASVFKSYNIKTKETVVVKVIDKLKDGRKFEILYNEVLILKHLNHPNIVSFIGHFEDHNNIYLIMEYLKGGHLINYLPIQEDIQIVRKYDIMYQISKGLCYLHSLGIVHRDIKPTNIAMTSINEDAIPKIIDFGLSTYLGEEESINATCGTLAFMAPELLSGQYYNKNIDIWSLGMVYYYLLYSKLPYDYLKDNDNDKKKLLEKLTTNFIVFPENENKNAKHILSSILRINSNERNNINSLVEDLEHLRIV